ncbi:tetratricopeptide repeat protein [Undibacterium rugosum]|uniref:tetratricopeptide repeat protein n=1 Tax=Undibacterium rugosum TaxID=2762291 RepID=UPI001B829BE0|nr:hypothetical protein [Undibacterium rugosum]MBR7780293.1 hypothetical protein [Undibacterium rugosum]
MSISDPAQLLQRIPELEELCTDTKIVRAIASGDSFKVYRALVIARLLHRLPQHQQLLKQLTSERRLFAKPLKGTPALGSFYSLGFNFIGQSETDTDNSYIAMHALSVLFVVPVIPLGAYVVKSTGDRQWQIYARAPLGLAGWLYTRGVAASLVAMVIAGAMHSQYASQHQEITMLNGFNQTLTIEAAGQTVALGAGQRQQLTLPAGKLQLIARTNDQEVIDRLDIDLKSSDKLSIWNISGAAPLVKNTHTYYKVKPVQTEMAANQVVYCGKQFMEFENIEYPFTEPPQSIQMSKHAESKSVEQLDVIRVQEGDGAHACIRYAYGNGSEQSMIPTLEAIAKMSQWAESDALSAIYTARISSLSEAIRLSSLAHQKQPGNLRLERILQDLRNEQGANREQLSEYGAKAKVSPDNPDAQYLYASLLQGKAGLTEMQKLHGRFPDHTAILRSLIWREYIHGDYQQGLRHLARLHQLSEADAQRLGDEEIFMLVALQRPLEAMKILDQYLNSAGYEDKFGAAAQLIRLYQLLGKDTALAISRLPEQLRKDPEALEVLSARTGLLTQQKNPATELLLKSYGALREQPEKVLDIVQNFSIPQFNQHFGRDQLYLLFVKASQSKKNQLEDRLAIVLNIAKPEREKIKAYIRGEAMNLDEYDIEPDLWNAARLLRSFNPNTPKSEQQSLRQQVIKSDVMHGVISYAAQHWQG